MDKESKSFPFTMFVQLMGVCKILTQNKKADWLIVYANVEIGLKKQFEALESFKNTLFLYLSCIQICFESINIYQYLTLTSTSIHQYLSNFIKDFQSINF